MPPGGSASPRRARGSSSSASNVHSKRGSSPTGQEPIRISMAHRRSKVTCQYMSRQRAPWRGSQEVRVGKQGESNGNGAVDVAAAAEVEKLLSEHERSDYVEAVV